jgi:hypothetical protein
MESLASYIMKNLFQLLSVYKFRYQYRKKEQSQESQNLNSYAHVSSPYNENTTLQINLVLQIEVEIFGLESFRQVSQVRMLKIPVLSRGLSMMMKIP